MGEQKVDVKKSYWKGKWAFFELSNLGDKANIYKNLKKLKGIKPEWGRKYQFEEHLPEEMKEDKQREKQIKYINKLQPDGQKIDISFKKGQMLVNNAPHRRKIDVINARTLLNLTPEDYKRLETAHMCQSGTMVEEDSHFTCYAAEVMNLDQIVDCYKHLKIKYGDATHVSMAFRLPGENVAELQDYFDDADYGIGRTILNVILDENRFYRAIYIVRRYGKKQLGSKRFDVAKTLAEQASRKIDAADSLGEVSKLCYPKGFLPKAFHSSLPRGEMCRSRWSIPDSLQSLDQQNDSGEIDFNTQKFQERLDRLRNVPYQSNSSLEDWANLTGNRGAWDEVTDRTIVSNK